MQQQQRKKASVALGSFFDTTPKGVAEWPRIDSEDPNYGGYNTKLVVPMAAGAPLAMKIANLAKEHFGSLKNVTLPYAKNAEDNTITFRFRSQYAVSVSDIHGAELETCPRIGNGTVMKVKAKWEAKKHTKGNFITAYMNGIQLLKLVLRRGAFEDASDEIENEDEEVAVVVEAREPAPFDDAVEEEGGEDLGTEADF